MGKISLKLVLICIMFCGPNAVSAEVRELELKGEGRHLLRPYSFRIENGTGGDIAFYLAADKERLIRQQLGPETMREFSDGKSKKYTIEIPTDDRDNSVRYSLLAGKRYKIYWNEYERRYDLEELVPR